MAGRQGSWQQYDVAVEYNVTLRARDGTRLATDIYRPALNGRPVEDRFPALIERTPYDKLRQLGVNSARFFARHGYVVALQDVRGRFASEGEWYAFAHEGPDGYDAVEWLASRPYCDGQVGTIGLSYSGSDQHALAALNPPHLRAMFVAEGMSNYHTSAMRQGGALEQRFHVYAFRMAESSREALADRALGETLRKAHTQVREWLGRAPLKPGASPLRLVPSYERWLLDITTHGDYDEYWKQPGLNIEDKYDQHANVPIYFLSAWYDTYPRAVTENYQQFARRGKGPCRIIFGPWTHGSATIALPYAGNVDFGAEAAEDYDGLRLRWFDRWLKGLDTGLDEEPPVRVFVMGGGDGRRDLEGRMRHGGRWRLENEWPLARVVATSYYLQAGGGLGLEPPAPALPSAYRYDPSDPVPTIGGSISAAEHVLPAGGYDQREREGLFGCKTHLPLAARPDVIVFCTPPLPRDLEVTGPIAVKLWASSSAVDTDFTAKLIDWCPPNEDYPEGYALNLADGIIRARYRESRERPEMMVPGTVYPFTITLYPTSNLFKAGHRMRLDVSSSNWPRFDVNPNTGEPLGRHSRRVMAENTIYHDPEHPSHVVLPVIPA